jgi:hypothetical protein
VYELLIILFEVTVEKDGRGIGTVEVEEFRTLAFPNSAFVSALF